METVDVRVFHNGALVDSNLLNDKVWVEGAILQIADAAYNVELNIPTINSMKLPKALVSGFPCFPRLEAEFVDLNYCEFTWYREKLEEKEEKSDGKKERKKKRTEVGDSTYWTYIHAVKQRHRKKVWQCHPILCVGLFKNIPNS